MGTKVWGLRFWSYAVLKQWGSILGVQATNTISFPINFSSDPKVLGVSSAYANTAAVTNESISSFRAIFPTANELTSFRWLAIGY